MGYPANKWKHFNPTIPLSSFLKPRSWRKPHILLGWVTSSHSVWKQGLHSQSISTTLALGHGMCLPTVSSNVHPMCARNTFGKCLDLGSVFQARSALFHVTSNTIKSSRALNWDVINVRIWDHQLARSFHAKSEAFSCTKLHLLCRGSGQALHPLEKV